MIFYISCSSSGSTMYLSLILITAFCSKALTLNCYNCTTSSQSNCTLSQCSLQCGSIVKYQTNGSNLITQKTCLDPCVNSSINLGADREAYVQCCKTDGCHKADTVALSTNKLQCYTCNATNCSLILDCKDIEDRCITFSQNLKGCASKNICDNSTLLQSMYSSVKDPNPKCCSDSLCNDGRSMTQSLVLLLVPPLLYILLLWD